MLIYNYSPDTFDYIGWGYADPDPLQPGNWLIPGSSTTVEPPPFDAETQTCRWNGAEWVVADIVIEEPPEPTPEELWVSYQMQAQIAMYSADRVAINCIKVGIAYPSDWLNYSLALNAVISATSGDPTIPLPTQPAFPPEISGL